MADRMIKITECKDRLTHIRLRKGRELSLDVEEEKGVFSVQWSPMLDGRQVNMPLVVGLVHKDIETDVAEHFCFLWREYAMCEDSRLTEGAKRVKYVMLEWFEEVRE